jgi:hypothetical protein
MSGTVSISEAPVVDVRASSGEGHETAALADGRDGAGFGLISTAKLNIA